MPAAVAFILQHSEAKVVLVDREFAPVMARALAQIGRKLLVVDIDDAWRGGERSADGLRGVHRRRRSGVSGAAAG